MTLKCLKMKIFLLHFMVNQLLKGCFSFVKQTVDAATIIAVVYIHHQALSHNNSSDEDDDEKLAKLEYSFFCILIRLHLLFIFFLTQIAVSKNESTIWIQI